MSPFSRIRPAAHAAPAAILILAAVAGPAVAAPPPRVAGGGDDPAIHRVQSAEDLALSRAKLERARALARGGSAVAALGRPGPIGAATVPCDPECVPSSMTLVAYARQQDTPYYCGPATGQVIVNKTRGVYSTSPSGSSTTTNYRTQAQLAAAMGTDAGTGTSSWGLRDGLNQYADLTVGTSIVRFTVIDPVATGADFHGLMIEAVYDLVRGAAVPVRMTYSSQHLVSWSNGTWWASHTGTEIRHWIPVRGYSGFWDGTYGPSLAYLDSSGGLGGGTGGYTDASRLVYNLNQANSRRVVI